MFKKILLATDGSSHAQRAAEVAADIAGTYGAELTIISVLPSSLALEEIRRRPQARHFSSEVVAAMDRLQATLEQTVDGDDGFADYIPAPQSAIRALGEEILKEAEAFARQKGVTNVNRVAIFGNPAQEILKQVAKAQSNLIVMGTRGLSDVGGLMFGSVSHKVIHMAECPCLTVK